MSKKLIPLRGVIVRAARAIEARRVRFHARRAAANISAEDLAEATEIDNSGAASSSALLQAWPKCC